MSDTGHATAARIAPAPSYFYLTVSYDIHDLCLSDTSYLRGPFPTEEARQQALAKDMSRRDLETGQTVNVTFLKVDDGKLTSEKSFIADEDEFDYDPDGDDDEDDEYDPELKQKLVKASEEVDQILREQGKTYGDAGSYEVLQQVAPKHGVEVDTLEVYLDD